MIGTIILGLALGLPLLLGIVFRVRATHLFFALMTGELLARYFGHDLGAIAALATNHVPPPGYGEAFLIVAPVLLTAFFLRGSLSRSKTMLHVIPLALTGIVSAAFLLPVLPKPILDEVTLTPLGLWLVQLDRVVIGTIVTAQLLALWLLNRGEGSKKH